jgi:hypothetical protein
MLGREFLVLFPFERPRLNFAKMNRIGGLPSSMTTVSSGAFERLVFWIEKASLKSYRRKTSDEFEIFCLQPDEEFRSRPVMDASERSRRRRRRQ